MYINVSRRCALMSKIYQTTDLLRKSSRKNHDRTINIVNCTRTYNLFYSYLMCARVGTRRSYNMTNYYVNLVEISVFQSRFFKIRF